MTKLRETLTYHFHNIFIRFGTKLYRQVVDIPMGTYRAPLIADLVSFCYKRDIMSSLSDYNEVKIIQAFNSRAR